MKTIFLLMTTLLLGQQSVVVVDLYLKDQPKLSQEISTSFESILKKHGLKGSLLTTMKGMAKKNSLFAPIPALFKQIKLYIKQDNATVALEFCQQGIDLYSEHFQHATEFYSLFKLLLYKGYIYNLQGDDDLSKQAMKSAVAMGYNYDFNGKLFSPRFVVKYKRLRKRSKRRANKNLQVNGVAGFQLFIDGQNIGKMPLTASKLLKGTHYIHLETADGTPVGGKVITVKKGINIETLYPSGQLPGGVSNQLMQKELSNYSVSETLRKYLKGIPKAYVLFGAGMVKPGGIYTHIYLYSQKENQIYHLGGFKFDRKLLMINMAVEDVVKKALKIIQGGRGKTIKPVPGVISSKKMYAGSMAPFKKLIFKQDEAVSVTAAKPVKTVKTVKPVKTVKTKNHKKEIDSDDVAKLKKEKMDQVSEAESIKNENIAIDLRDIKEDTTVHKDLGHVQLDLSTKPSKRSDDSVSTPFYKTWWFWTVTGVVVVGGATGAYFLMDQGGSSGKTAITVHW